VSAVLQVQSAPLAPASNQRSPLAVVAVVVGLLGAGMVAFVVARRRRIPRSS
jgi:hypothetical protein